MNVTLVHNALIPPPNYGGTERVIVWLCRALVALGHRVTLLAAPGSSLPDVEVIGVEDFSRWEDRVPAHTEILHLWGTPTREPKRPFLVTIEGNGKPGERFHPNTVFVSRKHAANHGSQHFVYNGLDPADYAYSEHKEDFAVFLAKAAWNVKNLEGAIDVARRAGLRLEVLGSRNWPLGLHRALPTVRGVKYRGMVDDAFKREMLPRARALIFPVRWHEPFGIALTEALVSGCFVVGTPYGSLPEIVSPEVGRLSANAGELAEALRDPRSFSPARCRARVLEHGFTHLDMARAYLKYYAQVLADGHFDRTAPVARGELQGQSLLPWN